MLTETTNTVEPTEQRSADAAVNELANEILADSIYADAINALTDFVIVFYEEMPSAIWRDSTFFASLIQFQGTDSQFQTYLSNNGFDQPEAIWSVYVKLRLQIATLFQKYDTQINALNQTQIDQLFDIIWENQIVVFDRDCCEEMRAALADCLRIATNWLQDVWTGWFMVGPANPALGLLPLTRVFSTIFNAQNCIANVNEYYGQCCNGSVTW